MTIDPRSGSSEPQWKTVSFREVLVEPVRNGVYKPAEFHGRGHLIVNMGEIFAHDFICDQPTKRVELIDSEVAKSALADGDLLFARRSFVLAGSGKCSIVVEPSETMTFESSLIRARVDKRIADPFFFYYLFRSQVGRDLMASIAVRTAVSGITGQDLMRLSVPCPDLPTQRAIARMLKRYDDLIRVNRRRMAALEESARLVFEEWFERFRFPGANGSELVDSDIGRIPSTFRPVRFSDAVRIDPKVALIKDRLKTYVPMAGLPAQSMVVSVFEQREGATGAKFENGDTLLAGITPSLENGKTGFVQFLNDGEAGLGSGEFIVLRSVSLCPEYVYFLARNERLREHAIQSMSGASGRQRVHNGCFDTFLIAHPDPETLARFGKLSKPMFSQVENLRRTNLVLERTRDFLLPLLISGDVDVSALPQDRSEDRS